MYFTETQVRSLVLTMKEHFPGAELVFDAYSPFMRWAHNFKVTRTGIGAHLHWALKRPQDLERWCDDTLAPHEAQRSAGVRLLEDWGWLDQPEPRLSFIRWPRALPIVGKMMRIYHYQLGKAVW